MPMFKVLIRNARYRGYDTPTDSTSRKMLCITPDFVNWSFNADDYRYIPGCEIIISLLDNIGCLNTSYGEGHEIRYIALEKIATEYCAVVGYAITMRRLL
jgi:hypothetical protein